MVVKRQRKPGVLLRTVNNIDRLKKCMPFSLAVLLTSESGFPLPRAVSTRRAIINIPILQIRALSRRNMSQFAQRERAGWGQRQVSNLALLTPPHGQVPWPLTEDAGGLGGCEAPVAVTMAKHSS